MPANLLPHLRHLNPSIPFAGISLMKPSPYVRASRVVPVLSRVFPHNLKYHQSFSNNIGLLPNMSSHQELRLVVGTHQLSTLSAVRASRSLIDDEAELIYRVSDLSTGNDRNRGDGFSRGRGGRGGRGRGGRGGRGGGEGEGRFSSGKRSRDSDSDGYGYGGGNRGEDSWSSYNFSRGRGGRGGGGRFGGESERSDDRFSSRGENGYEGGRGGSSSSRGRGGGGRFGGGSDRRDDRFSSRGENGYGGGRGGSSSSRGRGNAGSFDSFQRSSSGRGQFENGGRGSDSDDYGVPSRGRGERGGRGRGRGNWGSLDSFTGSSRGTERFGGRSEREDGGYVSRGRNYNFRGGARGSGRGGGEMKRGGKTFGRTSFSMSEKDTEDDLDDEESDEKLMGTFGDLISEDEDDDGADEDDSDEAGDYEMLTESKSLSEMDINDSPPVTPRSSPGASDSHLSQTRFDQCAISELSLKAIKDAGYEKMTIVQEATLPLILKGKDVLAKAKTGTGKTVAFLLPSIETITKLSSAGHDQRRPPIYVLVICPTRELASQAATEANTLSKYHRSIGVQVVIGGTRLTLEQKRLQANPCQILVATPGRLKDHIENTTGFATRLMGVKVLVLDEADHLLDMGFRRDIERIIAAVPKERQTLLFSATVPPEVRQICHIALKRDHEFINTVKDTEETHAQVRQTHLVAPLDKQFSILYALLKDHIADDPDYKVLVFCTTAMVTKLVADLLGVLKMNVREIHSRKPQNYRTRVSDEFRKSTGIILVTSDVSARGVDYPDVTFVIQVGLPSDKQQYIHRLGRTGRKGKEGQGLLLLAPWEEFFLSTLKDLPLSKAESPLVDPDTKKLVDRALSHVEMKNKESAYQAWLGYYNSNKTVGRDKIHLVELANEFSRSMGLDIPPAISKQTLGKMGLRNVPGLRSK